MRTPAHPAGVLVLALSLALAGCSGTGGHIDDNAQEPSNIDLARSNIADLRERWRNRNAPPPVDPGPQLQAGLVDSAGFPLMVMETSAPVSFTILVGLGAGNGQVHWRTGEDQGVSTARGLIVATQGLGFDRADSDLRGTIGALFEGGPRQGYTRIHRALDGEGQMQAEAFVCDLHEIGREILTLAQRRFDTRILHESCTGAQTTFENRYWLDRRGKIRASEQWMGPGERFFRLELVTL